MNRTRCFRLNESYGLSFIDGRVNDEGAEKQTAAGGSGKQAHE